MPNWKKVVVSGSDAVLNSITSSAGISSSGFVYAPLFVGDLFGNASTATSATNAIAATSASTLLTINTNSNTTGEYRITFVPSGTEANYNTLNVDDDDLRYIPNPGRLYVPNVFSSGDIHAEGNVIANQYIVSSSVYYTTQSFSSGSTIFGNDQTDTHQFTGSLYVTGGLIVEGKPGFQNVISGDSGWKLVGYQTTVGQSPLHWLEMTSGLLEYRTNGSAKFRIRSQNGSLDNTYIHFNNSDVPLKDLSMGVSQKSGSFIIASGSTLDTRQWIFITGSTGNVGINTSTPGEKLTVEGNISASGALFASLSLDNSNFNTVMYDTTTGKFYYTGSYGSSDNLGDHTATQDLDLDSNDIINVGDIGAQTITATTFTGDLVGSSSWASNAVSSSHSWNITDGTNGEGVGSNDTIRFSGQYATTVTYNPSTNTVGISTPDLSPSVTALNAASSSYLISASVIGTTNEVEVTANGSQGIQIGLPDDVTITNNITVNNDISGSGQLFASLSLDNSNFNTVMYDTTTGKFYYTGSYGGGGGGGGTTLTGLDTEIVFFNGDDNPDSIASFTFDQSTTFFSVGNSVVNSPGSIWVSPAAEWDGNFMHAKGYPTVVNASYGVAKRIDFVGITYNNRWEALAGPGMIGGGVQDGVSTGTISDYLPGSNYITGSEVTFNGALYVANFYALVNDEEGYVTLFINASGSGGGPIQGPGGGVVIDGSVGGMVLSPDYGMLMFDANEMEKDASGSLLTPIESASAQIKLADDKTSLSIKVGKTNLKDVMFISASGDNPKIGVGTTDPKATFDIKEVKDSTTGTRFLLKSARTTTGAQVGDSAGSINFAIDSASFNDIFTSGSVAAIDSRVRSIDTTGGGVPNVAGNIIFKSSPEWIETLKEVAEIGYFHFDNLNPSEDSEPGMVVNGQLTVGSGSLWQSAGGDVAFSVYNRDSISDYNNYLKLRVTGSNVDIPTGSLSVSKSISTEGEITTNTISTISTVIDSDSATIVDSFQGLDYQGAIYDYLLFDDGVGVRSGQFFLAQNPGTAEITFTDTSTPHLIDSVAPEISASYNTSYVEVKVINGNGYTFKAFVKKL